MNFNYGQSDGKLNAFYGSSAFLAGIGVMLLFELLLGVIIQDKNTLYTVFSYGSQTIFFVAAVLFTFFSVKGRGATVAGRFGATFSELGFRGKLSPLQVLLSVALPIVSIIAFLPVSTLVEFIFSKIGYNQMPSYADYTSSPAALVGGIFGLCLFPAFGEEFLMRGALMRGLREKGSLFAITISSLMFAIMHGSPVQFIYQLLIGLLMAYMVYITDRLLPSMIFHFFNNATVIFYNYGYVRSNATFSIPPWVLAIMFVVGLALVLLLLTVFTRVTLARRTGFAEQLRDMRATHGKFKGTVRAVLGQSEYGYTCYNKAPCFVLYIGIGIISFLWIFNTISAWLPS